MTGTNWWQGLWEQLSSFSPYYSHQPGHHWMNWRGSWKGGGSCRVECTVRVWKHRRGPGYFFCVNASVRVCACMCAFGSVLSHVQGWSVVAAAPELQVSLCPVDCEPPLFPRKMLSTGVGLPQSSTDIWKTPGMSLPIKGQHLAIFISAIKKGTIRGKRGNECEARLRREWKRVGIEGRSGEGMSAPAMAASAAKEKIAPKRMMKYDSAPTSTPSSCIIFNKPFNKKEWPLLTSTLHLVVIVGGSTLPSSETEKWPGACEGKSVSYKWSLSVASVACKGHNATSLQLFWSMQNWFGVRYSI